jgi:hypothetical protein
LQRVRGAFREDETYGEVVALNGSSFIARHDDPRPCPGEGWQLIASAGRVGRPGQKGERGEKGEAGPRVVSSTFLISLSSRRSMCRRCWRVIIFPRSSFPATASAGFP